MSKTMSDMKEMVYDKRCGYEHLVKSTYKGYKYLITSLGTHPCAYVKMPRKHKCYKGSYYDLPISVHGGVTYSSTHPEFRERVVGWDYAHSGDFVANMPVFGGHKWTVAEILEDVKSVINQLIALNKNV
jgi:hypothetical protein